MNDLSVIEQVMIKGDLAVLNADQRTQYYKAVCESVNLNPLTKPFEYITLNGKMVLYATKGCGEQLRHNNKISIKIANKEKIEDVYVVTAEAIGKDGRCDSATGAVAVKGLAGEALANAFMKAETKAKRRVTLSICGLNMLDEIEVNDIPKENKIDPIKIDSKPAATPSYIKQSDHKISEGLKLQHATFDVPQYEDGYMDAVAKQADAYAHEQNANNFFNEEELAPQKDYGTYVCKIGAKNKGVTLNQMGPDNVYGFQQWLLNNAKSKGENLKGNAEEFVFEAEKWLDQIRYVKPDKR